MICLECGKPFPPFLCDISTAALCDDCFSEVAKDISILVLEETKEIQKIKIN